MRRHLSALLLLAPVLSSSALIGVLPAQPAVAAVTIDGPDVSSYQHPGGASINWAAVAKAGHEFAIVKATEGTSYVNHYFGADYAGIRKAGMVRGSYHYARPSAPVARSALAQAQFYVSRIGATTTTSTLPPALDLEETGGLSRPSLITWAQDFLLDVRRLTGRTPIIYTYPWFWQYTIGDSSAFSRYPLWMAAYHGMTPEAGTTLWQYTAGAKVSGIKGPVDMSRLLADPTTFAALADGATPTPWPAAPPATPVAVRGVPAVSAATVTWLPPDTGSAPISSYRVTIAPADGSAPARGATVSGSRCAATFTGLTNGAPYVVTVQAASSAGTGPVAAPTATVTPQFPTRMVVTGPGLVNYGTAAVLQAVLTRADNGQPLVGVPVTFSTRPTGGGAWTVRGTLWTDAAGRVVRAFAPGRHDDIRFTYAGAVGLQPAAAVHTVRVRKLVRAHLSATTVRIRHGVAFTGAVIPAERGVLVVSQRYVGGGRWQTLQRGRTNARGGFRFVLKPMRRGAVAYRIVVGSTPSRLAGVSPTVILRGI